MLFSQTHSHVWFAGKECIHGWRHVANHARVLCYRWAILELNLTPVMRLGPAIAFSPTGRGSRRYNAEIASTQERHGSKSRNSFDQGENARQRDRRDGYWNFEQCRQERGRFFVCRKLHQICLHVALSHNSSIEDLHSASRIFPFPDVFAAVITRYIEIPKTLRRKLAYMVWIQDVTRGSKTDP